MAFIPDPATGIGSFEGPEKTVILCFKSSKMAVPSLRLIAQDSWSMVLEHAQCQILSMVQSGPVELIPHGGGKSKKMSTSKITGYLLSESSLFLSDNTLTLKTCGTTTPLLALEPILDLVVPTWRDKDASKYIKYMSFTRLGYRFPDKQPDPHSSWTQEVEFLDKHFAGRHVVLGTAETSTYHAYVANYLRKDEVLDCAVSTQVALGHLDPAESMRHFVETEATDKTPLKTVWQDMHGGDARSIAADPQLDECFFEPIGYSANAVFSNRFTTIHATPQPCSSYVSVETSMPLSRDAKQRFCFAAQSMCSAGSLSVTEFALSPPFFPRGAPPEIPGFEVKGTWSRLGDDFGCALHYYVRSSVPQGGCVPAPMADVAICKDLTVDAPECALAQAVAVI